MFNRFWGDIVVYSNSGTVRSSSSSSSRSSSSSSSSSNIIIVVIICNSCSSSSSRGIVVTVSHFWFGTTTSLASLSINLRYCRRICATIRSERQPRQITCRKKQQSAIVDVTLYPNLYPKTPNPENPNYKRQSWFESHPTTHAKASSQDHSWKGYCRAVWRSSSVAPEINFQARNPLTVKSYLNPPKYVEK